jgi:mono/diheme cytochrome c family protein
MDQRGGASERSSKWKKQAGMSSAHGEELFNDSCAQCHGGEATGAIGPALNSEQFLGCVTDKQMHQRISTGVSGTLMVAYSADFGGSFTQHQITAMVVYLRSVEETAPDFPDCTSRWPKLT